ncbi:MAG: hypothetical protein ACR5LD_03100 [Symbiopectobacterium sp.]
MHQAFSRFIGSHLVIAFDDNPEAALRPLGLRHDELGRAINNFDAENQ